MENEQEEKVELNITTEEITSEQPKLDTFSNLEQLRKSETEVKTSTQTQTSNMTELKKDTLAEDRVFARKEDKKKTLFKRRAKILASVYASVCALMLAFVGINLATLIMTSTEMTTNTQTITSQQTQLDDLKKNTVENDITGETIYISPNEPRDYSDDVKPLTFWDKITIVFKNIFS